MELIGQHRQTPFPLEVALHGHACARKVQDPRGIFLLHAYNGPSGPILVTFAESPLSKEDLYSSDTEELNKGKKDFYPAL